MEVELNIATEMDLPDFGDKFDSFDDCRMRNILAGLKRIDNHNHVEREFRFWECRSVVAIPL